MAEKRQQEAVTHKQITAPKTLKTEYVEYFNSPLRIGQIATILDGRGKHSTYNRLIARQVINEKSVLCSLIKYDYDPITHSIRMPGGIHEIASILLTNFDTTGIVDGAIVDCDHQFIISGTRTLRTAIGGQSTVFVFEPYR